MIFSDELKIEKFDILDGIINLPNSFNIFLNIIMDNKLEESTEVMNLEEPVKPEEPVKDNSFMNTSLDMFTNKDKQTEQSLIIESSSNNNKSKKSLKKCKYNFKFIR